jgi:hypothetical protein
MQVVTHGLYHLERIAKIISQSGVHSIKTDFITFAREMQSIEFVECIQPALNPRNSY